MDEKKKEFIKEHYTFDDLTAIMALLRSEDGCPWDRAQDHRSIRKNLIEECYEAVEGIDRDDRALLCEELGDVLLQIVFHAQISADRGSFDIDDVVDGVCRKMIRRHPHIFGDARAADPADAYARWEEIKRSEKGSSSACESMEGVAKTLPSLMRTQKLLKKVEKAGLFEEGDLDRGDALMSAYFGLCRAANAAGIDLEERAYAENEQYISEIKEREAASTAKI